jgi:hypothetical protein
MPSATLLDRPGGAGGANRLSRNTGAKAGPQGRTSTRYSRRPPGRPARPRAPSRARSEAGEDGGQGRGARAPSTSPGPEAGAARARSTTAPCAIAYLVAQVIGMPKDHAAMAQCRLATVRLAARSRVWMATISGRSMIFRCGSPTGFPPGGARSCSPGHLQLTLGRSGERIVVDRWGLANMALKRFTLSDWLHQRGRAST